MKTFLVALIESVLTAIYWWSITTVSFGLFGGSRDPAAPPPDENVVMAQTVGTVLVAIILYALLSIAWRKAVRPRLG